MRRGRIVAEQGAPDALQDVGVPCKPAASIEARRERTNAVQRIRPCVGRIPRMPQKLAGRRTEPPVSLPTAKSTTPAATADAEPLDEPPVTRPGAFTFTGAP